MTRHFLGPGLLLAATVLASGCCGHKGCHKGAVVSAPPCCPPPAPPPCCPGPGGTIPPPPVGSNYGPPVVAIPAH